MLVLEGKSKDVATLDKCLHDERIHWNTKGQSCHQMITNLNVSYVNIS